MNELNIIINNEFFNEEKDLVPLLFDNEKYVLLDMNKDIYDCLILLNIFNSRNQARKNWNKTQQFEKGYNEYKNIGKNKKALFIWNPVSTKYLKN